MGNEESREAVDGEGAAPRRACLSRYYAMSALQRCTPCRMPPVAQAIPAMLFRLLRPFLSLLYALLSRRGCASCRLRLSQPAARGDILPSIVSFLLRVPPPARLLGPSSFCQMCTQPPDRV